MFLDQFEPNKGLSTQKEKHIMYMHYWKIQKHIP